MVHSRLMILNRSGKPSADDLDPTSRFPEKTNELGFVTGFGSVICSALAPTALRPLTLWIASASLRYWLAMIINLPKLPVLDQGRDLLVRQVHDVMSGFFEGRFFYGADVGLVALGESVDEEGAMGLAVQDQGSITARTSLPGTRHALPDDAAAEVGIDQALFGSPDRLT